MPLDFSRKSPEEAVPKNEKKPPNYFSRRVQYRLMLLVGIFMLVLLLMDEARKPSNYQFLFGSSDEQGLTQNEIANEDIDTRFVGSPRPTNSDPPGIVTVGDSSENNDSSDQVEVPSPLNSNSAEDETATNAQEEEQPDAVRRAEKLAWSSLVAKLDEHESVFYATIKAAIDGTTLALEDRNALTALIPKLDQHWTAYITNAHASIAQSGDEDSGGLSDEQKANWLALIQQLELDWANQVKPQMDKIAYGETSEASFRPRFVKLQVLLDEIALDAVRDDMVWLRSENQIQLRLFDRLNKMSPAEVVDQSEGRVGFLQLYRQPDVYRGKLVTVRGALRQGVHISKGNNLYQIPGYYHFWLKPAGGPDSPIVVNCLEKPEGFPEIGTEYVILDEDVEVTGYFLKRWVYASQDGAVRLAPMLLAKNLTWSQSQAFKRSNMPDDRTMWIGIGLTALGAVVIAILVYFSSGWRTKSPYEADPKQLAALAETENVFSLDERLKNLENPDSDNE